VALQLELLPTGDPKEQVALGEKPPAASVERVTVPVGADPPSPPLSVTVAVQVVPWPTLTGEVQLTAVVVARSLTVRLKAVAVLAACTVLEASL
jgi:hypothetical protein